jgi:nitroreductase
MRRAGSGVNFVRARPYGLHHAVAGAMNAAPAWQDCGRAVEDLMRTLNPPGDVMTDTIDLLRSRRSVAPAAMTGPGPTPDEITTLLTLAARVPDHGKLAPWRFILLEGDARGRLGDAAARIFAADNPGEGDDRLAVERTRFTRAPLVVGVVSRAAPHVKIPEWEQVLSAGACCFNLCVAANAMGFATAWLTEWVAYDRRVLDVLGLAPHEKMAGFVYVGRGEKPADRVRPELADIVTRWTAPA